MWSEYNITLSSLYSTSPGWIEWGKSEIPFTVLCRALERFVLPDCGARWCWWQDSRYGSAEKAGRIAHRYTILPTDVMTNNKCFLLEPWRWVVVGLINTQVVFNTQKTFVNIFMSVFIENLVTEKWTEGRAEWICTLLLFSSEFWKLFHLLSQSWTWLTWTSHSCCVSVLWSVKFEKTKKSWLKTGIFSVSILHTFQSIFHTRTLFHHFRVNYHFISMSQCKTNFRDWSPDLQNICTSPLLIKYRSQCLMGDWR